MMYISTIDSTTKKIKVNQVVKVIPNYGNNTKHWQWAFLDIKTGERLNQGSDAYLKQFKKLETKLSKL